MRVEEEAIETYICEHGEDRGRIAIRFPGNPQVVLEDGDIICGVSVTPHMAREVAFQLLDWAEKSEAEYGTERDE